MIKRVMIHHFGGLCRYEAELKPSFNLIDTPYREELAAAIERLLCSKACCAHSPVWVCDDTRICAEVELEGCSFFVQLQPLRGGELALRATDCAGKDVTEQYQYRMSHCIEQDAVESFDGCDQSLPVRLCQYRYGEAEAEGDALPRTKAFRAYLLHYIRNFRPERINNARNYLLTMDPQGRFRVVLPGFSGRVNLSETEKKLFLYTCFLNIAEFWREIETIRDLHHEKKPLVIKNFLEYLDATTDIEGLLQRTVRLRRQILLLTAPLDEQTKQKWTGQAITAEQR